MTAHDWAIILFQLEDSRTPRPFLRLHRTRLFIGRCHCPGARKRTHGLLLPAMTTIVGIFDNARDLDKAVERLARAGFEDTVYDEAIVAEEVGNIGPVFAPGSAPVVIWGSAAKPALPRKPGRQTIVRAFKAHLADYHLPKNVIEAYVTNFNHNGEFVLVRTDTERAGQVLEILRECGATRVNRHD